MTQSLSSENEFRQKLLQEGSGYEVLGNLYKTLLVDLNQTLSHLEQIIGKHSFEDVERHYSILNAMHKEVQDFYLSSDKSVQLPRKGKLFTDKERNKIDNYLQSLSPGEYSSKDMVKGLAESGINISPNSLGVYLSHRIKVKSALNLKYLKEKYCWEKY